MEYHVDEYFAFEEDLIERRVEYMEKSLEGGNDLQFARR